MPSKMGFGFLFVTLVVMLVVAGNYILTQAYPLTPHGITIIVNTNVEPQTDGLCSLREAVQAANQDITVDGCPAGSGADIIILDSLVYTLTNSGANEDVALTGDLDITDDLEIRGTGSSSTFISADMNDRVFHIDPAESGIQVKITNLSIQGGVAPVDDDEGGGGILSNGALTLENVIIKGNNANRGGGIRVDLSGEIMVTDSQIEGNWASNEGGGIYGDGPIELVRVEIFGNEARRGGGVFCDRPCDFLDITINDNQATTHGGGFYNDDITVLTNVTINSNMAIQRNGGGIYNEDEITLNNVTISGNSASQGSGFFSDTVAHLKNVTIYQNNSPINGASLYNDLMGYLDLVNTIVAVNSTQPGCFGDLVSLGHNLSSDFSCDFAQATDLRSVDPMLDALLDNGGETQTHALQLGSPAVDAGKNSACLPYDQRYLSRPVDGDRDGEAHCDIGAYEIMPGGNIRFSQITLAVDEADGTAQLTVERAEGSAGEVSVGYFTWEEYPPGNANSNADYIYTSGTLTWADGNNSVKFIEIPIVDDPSQENEETFSVILYAAMGGAGISSAARVAVVTIQDNDPPPAPTATPVPEPDRVYLPIISESE